MNSNIRNDPSWPNDHSPGSGRCGEYCPACNSPVAREHVHEHSPPDQRTEAHVPCFHGSCHCGAVTFRIDAAIEELTTCDCSLCTRKNALMTKVREHELTVLSGKDLLASYEWNTHRAKHFFCSRCGIYTFHRKRAAPDHFGVNVFCLEGFDPNSVPVRATEGIGMTVVDPAARQEWRGPRASS